MDILIEEYIQLITSPNSIREIFTLTVNIVILVIVFDVLRMIKTILVGQYLAARTTPMSSQPSKELPSVHVDSVRKNILVVGDSTAVGTGAQSPQDSLAGRLARDFPHSKIVNLAANGSLTRNVLEQLEKREGECFDMIFISTGGNDIWHFSRISKLKRDLEKILILAKEMSRGRVFLLLYNNIGDAPAFSFLTRDFLKKRGEKVHAVFKEVSSKHGVPYIELFTEEERNPFLDSETQKVLFAADGIHPSGDGYRYWYNRMWREMVKRGYNRH